MPYPGSICLVMSSRESAERIVVNRSEVVLGDMRIFEDSGDGRREVERQVETRQTMQLRACASCSSNHEKLSH